MRVSGANWPDQKTLSESIKRMKKNRPSNIRFREAAAAKRVIGLMQRPEAGTLGNDPLGQELDAQLEKLLL